MHKFKAFLAAEITFVVLFFIVLVNLIVIDVWIMGNAGKLSPVIIGSDKEEKNKPALAECGDDCKAAIKKEVAAALKDEPARTTVNTVVGNDVKEYFVPFGAGSSTTDDWADVQGLSASINTASYGSIKKVVFEASLRIPTGNQTAYARLYNVTDKHPVWFSEVSLDGGTAKLVISSPITLDSGEKTYQVQMKTSLKFPAYLDQARVHITLN